MNHYAFFLGKGTPAPYIPSWTRLDYSRRQNVFNPLHAMLDVRSMIYRGLPTLTKSLDSAPHRIKHVISFTHHWTISTDKSFHSAPRYTIIVDTKAHLLIVCSDKTFAFRLRPGYICCHDDT